MVLSFPVVTSIQFLNSRRRWKLRDGTLFLFLIAFQLRPSSTRQSMQRVLRYDGLLPNKLDQDGRLAEIAPADIQAMKMYIDEHCTSNTPFDIAWEGRTPGEDR